MMDTRKTVLFHCQHSMGMGHLVRSLTLAKTLAKRFRVVLLNGGELPEGMTFPSELDVIHLPPIGQLIDHSLYSIDTGNYTGTGTGNPAAPNYENFQRNSPGCVVYRAVPFWAEKICQRVAAVAGSSQRTRQKCADYRLQPARYSGWQSQRSGTARKSRCVAGNRYFDAVLSHADPDFAQLEETFQPQIPLKTPVFYTGFVLPKQEIQPVDFSEIKISKTLVVSVAGDSGTIFSVTLQPSHRRWVNILD
ncbi:MAG: hypothetical protein R3C26_12865 [Calditrichia bacterium]